MQRSDTLAETGMGYRAGPMRCRWEHVQPLPSKSLVMVSSSNRFCSGLARIINGMQRLERVKISAAIDQTTPGRSTGRENILRQ